MNQERTNSNPFPASAVARLSQAGSELAPITIQTQALRDGVEHVNEYLNRTERENAGSRDGSVIAIVGEYGTGKTFLAYSLLQAVTAAGRENVHVYYLDAPADTFLGLYKQRFFPLLRMQDVHDRVEEYYADTLAEELEASQLTKDLSVQLRTRAIDPAEVVAHFGFTESALVRRLGKRLHRVTEKGDFGTAMLLLRRPEFESAVWEWLAGNPPDPALVERGVARTIDHDAIALEAMAVMAHIFGQQQHRFVLAIDELEKVLSSTFTRPDKAATLLAFKKFMESMGKTGALLILSGLPDFLEALAPDAVQRISRILKPSPLVGSDVQEYIRAAKRLAGGTDSLDPFSQDSAAYIAEIAGGNARKTVRLCYYAYEQAQLSRVPVSRATIREVARGQFEIASSEDVGNEILNVIKANGWNVERQKVVGSGEERHTLDFWLPVRDGGEACAIILTTSILHQQDIDVLAARSKATRVTDTSGPKVLLLLVINGYLAENLSKKLAKQFDDVLIYKARQFADSLQAVLTGWRYRLEQRSKEDTLTFIKERVEQIVRQNSNLSVMLARERSRESARELQIATVTGLRSFFGQLAAGETHDVEDPAVAEFFRSATPRFTELVAASRRIILNYYSSIRNRSFGPEGELPAIASSIKEILAADAVVGGLRRAVTLARTSEDRDDFDTHRVIEAMCLATDMYARQLSPDRLGANELKKFWDLQEGPRPDIEGAIEELRELGREVFFYFEGRRKGRTRQLR